MSRGKASCASLSTSAGKVTEVKILHSTGQRRFDEGAVDAFLRWRAKPGLVREVDMPLTFAMLGKKPPVATEG